MSRVEFRPVAPHERAAALKLWYTVFSPGEDYFQRYFNADPWYQEGDCLGAWDGDRLVSAAHLCRRPVYWNGRTLWCGAIANVGTLPDYRRQGLSRALLERLIQRMEGAGMDFSMLFTGTHGHYAALGWEQVLTPEARVTLGTVSPLIHRIIGTTPLTQPEHEADVAIAEMRREMRFPPVSVPLEGDSTTLLNACVRLYSYSTWPPLHLERTEVYFRGWVAWNWEQWKATLFVVSDHGYAVVTPPAEPGAPARLIELRAARSSTDEWLILGHVATRLQALGIHRLATKLLPRAGGLSELHELGTVEPTTYGGMMLRNQRLPEAEFREVVRLYHSGEATWWLSDGF